MIVELHFEHLMLIDLWRHRVKGVPSTKGQISKANNDVIQVSQ